MPADEACGADAGGGVPADEAGRTGDAGTADGERGAAALFIFRFNSILLSTDLARFTQPFPPLPQPSETTASTPSARHSFCTNFNSAGVSDTKRLTATTGSAPKRRRLAM